MKPNFKPAKSALIIYHKADFDGLMSAAVVSLAEPNATLFGWNYDEPPVVKVDPNVERVYVVDLSMDSVLMDDPRVVWIDHHKTAIAKYKKSIAGLRIDGVAACRLCWQYCFGDPSKTKEDYVNCKVYEPELVKLLGEYDVWTLSDDAVNLQYGLTAEIGGKSNPKQIEWLRDVVAVHEPLDDFIFHGNIIKQWHQIFAKKVITQSGYEVLFEGLKFLAINSAHAIGSLWFDGVSHEGYDGLMSLRLKGDDKVSVSLYGTGKDVDLSKIAVKYGGGGHKAACGFSIGVEKAVDLKLIR